jgi:ABC-2 type transport system permease protein
MRHQLQREWWRVLMLAGGAIWSLTLIPGVLWAQQVLVYQPRDIKEFALVAVAFVLIFGWVVVPLLITGLDDTLDPGRFASLGIQGRAIMPGLTLAALLTVPVVFFLAVMLILASVWRSDGVWVLLVGMTGAALTVLVMVFSARVSVMWASRLLSSRRSRLTALVAIGVGLAFVAPAAAVLFRDGFQVVVEYDVPVLIEWVGRTPIGAGMAAAGAASTGDWWAAGWRLAMVAAWAMVLHRAWRANVDYALVHPVYRGGGSRQRHDTLLAAAARTSRLPRAWQLSGPALAVRTRSLRYWSTDPRYLASLVGVLTFPVLFFALVMPAFGLDGRWAFIAPVLLAASIGWGRHNDVAYDSTAVWLDITAGSVGGDVMRGRMAAILVWAVPSVVIAALGTLAWTRLWELAPAVIGGCLGVLGLTLGISSLTSVLLPYRAPAPGENPFGAEVGSVGASLLAQVVSSVGTMLALPLVTLPFVLALGVHPGWGWVSLVTGLALGPIALLAGVNASGRLYDRRSGHLVHAVS